jgi:FAD/FMN-containing dehydrogenase
VQVGSIVAAMAATDRASEAVDRRAFLRRAGTASAAIGATALIGATADCARGGQRPQSSGSTGSTGTTGTTRTTGTTGPPRWSALAGMLTGTLVVPGDAAYPDNALLYNEVFSPRPAAIAYCATATDVQRCLVFARQHHVELAARSGGHSYGGYSSCPGLVIDVSSLNAVSVGPGRTTAQVGAGAQLIDVYSQLGSSGLLLPGGSCPSVGIAGLALGGGIGVFGRAYGLTCDNIASLTLVTADGALRTCTPSTHDDLYWASRGGGGGNFGVVTSFTFTVHPIPSVTLFTLEWPWAEAPAVLDAWLTWIPSTPNELWANCQLFSNGAAGGGLLKVTGVFAGETAACASALSPLLAAVQAAPTYQFVGPENYLRAMLIEAGCEGLTVGQCHVTTRNPTGTLSRSAFAAKSTFIDSPLPAPGTAAVVQAVDALASEVPGVSGGIVFDGYGGVINQVPSHATAFVHRDAIACAQYSITYPAASPSPTVVAAAHSWLEQTQSSFAPYAKGSYQNYIDPTLPDWAQAYYGTNLTRLTKIKRTYDPDDVFHFAQSVPLERS